MKITPQHEYYGLGGASRRVDRPLPTDLAGMLSGPSIHTGLLDTRTGRHDDYDDGGNGGDAPDYRRQFIDWANANRRPTDADAVDEWAREHLDLGPAPASPWDDSRGDEADRIYHMLDDDPTLDPSVLPEPPDEGYR